MWSVFLYELVGWYSSGLFVFFQAEDGIRDLVRSRGLGDVYKRQGSGRTGRGAHCATWEGGLDFRLSRSQALQGSGGPVSYTHLTLPTSDLV